MQILRPFSQLMFSSSLCYPSILEISGTSTSLPHNRKSYEKYDILAQTHNLQGTITYLTGRNIWKYHRLKCPIVPSLLDTLCNFPNKVTLQKINWIMKQLDTLLETNISPTKALLKRWFFFSRLVGYVNSPGGYSSWSLPSWPNILATKTRFFLVEKFHPWSLT